MITAQMVKEAYEKTGLQPVQSCWIGKQKGEPCACGISALVVARSSIENMYILNQTTNLMQSIPPILEISKSYMEGFIEAFDGNTYYEDDIVPEDYKAGHAVGEESRKLVFGE